MGLSLSDIKKFSCRSGLNITKIRRRSDMAILWSAEEFIFQNGVLADGTAYQNFTNSNGYFYAYVETEQGEDPPYDARKSALISFDFTDYDYIDITLDYNTYANYGGASINYGIDGYTPSQLPHSNNNRVNMTVTLDISSYSGVHSIDFVLYALNESSEPSWGASSSIWIKEVKMYNGESQSGNEYEYVEFHKVEDGKLIILGARSVISTPEGLYLDCEPEANWTYPVQNGNVLRVEQVYKATQNGNVLEVE